MLCGLNGAIRGKHLKQCLADISEALLKLPVVILSCLVLETTKISKDSGYTLVFYTAMLSLTLRFSETSSAFYFEVIKYSQEIAKIVQRGSYSSLVTPNGYILCNYCPVNIRKWALV